MLRTFSCVLGLPGLDFTSLDCEALDLPALILIGENIVSRRILPPMVLDLPLPVLPIWIVFFVGADRDEVIVLLELGLLGLLFATEGVFAFVEI